MRYMLLSTLWFLQSTQSKPANIALLIIDVQGCFLPGGNLAVTEGDQVIPIINKIRTDYKTKFSQIVLTKDWHCSDHVSFVSEHQGYNTYQEIYLQYDADGKICTDDSPCATTTYNITQMLWPNHCVINSTEANISANLTRELSDIIVLKGYHCNVDSYSAFNDNGGFTHTELDGKLKSLGIDTVFVTGLALDYCVYYTAKDAITLGYKTYVVEDASRPVAIETGNYAILDMQVKGVKLIQSSEVGNILNDLLAVGAASLTMPHLILYLISCLSMVVIAYQP